MTTELHEAFDWLEVARLVLTSRAMDDMEESSLYPSGDVPYQFSARGHELGQVLLSRLLRLPGICQRLLPSRPFMLGAGLTAEEASPAWPAPQPQRRPGRGRRLQPATPRGPTVLPMAGDVGSQFTPAAGWAQALCYRRHELGEEDLQGIAVVFGGDGAATNGFWSALTLATTLSLPLLSSSKTTTTPSAWRSGCRRPGNTRQPRQLQNLAIWQGTARAGGTAALVVAVGARAGRGRACCGCSSPAVRTAAR